MPQNIFYLVSKKFIKDYRYMGLLLKGPSVEEVAPTSGSSAHYKRDTCNFMLSSDESDNYAELLRLGGAQSVVF